ncbi:unnamed protein product [Amoebophrya sp. A25]|nr:unnamed protein product [Amoebophrya sp. A25]|eukprot:GSA25T00020171001.1
MAFPSKHASKRNLMGKRHCEYDDSNPAATEDGMKRRKGDAEKHRGTGYNRERLALVPQNDLRTDTGVLHRKGYGDDDEKVVHVIFCIDQSGSMRTCDVSKTFSSGIRTKLITRWDAVFHCAEEFVESQVSTQRDAASGAPIEVSLVTWNNSATVVFEREPVAQRDGTGKAIIEKLRKARDENHPSHGTTFAAGLKCACDILTRHIEDLAEEREREDFLMTGGDPIRGEFVISAPRSSGFVKPVVIFLSDGRPGDLDKVPSCASEEMKRTYRLNGREYTSAARHLEQLRDKFESDLHFVGIYEEGFPWLRWIAEKYGGHFHEARLELDEIAPLMTNNPMQPKYQGFRARGQAMLGIPTNRDSMIDLGLFAPSSAQPGDTSCFGATMHAGSSSLRSTFLNISAAVTSLRQQPAVQVERDVKLVEDNEEGSTFGSACRAEMKQYDDVTVMELKNGKLKPVAGVAKKTVSLPQQPFAQGGLRNVYRMTEILENHSSSFGKSSSGTTIKKLVAKESRYEVPYAERLAFHLESSKCQERAISFAAQWNALDVVQRDSLLPHLHFLRTDVYRIREDASTQKFRYLAVEEELQGKYRKFNGNNGWVRPTTKNSSKNVTDAFGGGVIRSDHDKIGTKPFEELLQEAKVARTPASFSSKKRLNISHQPDSSRQMNLLCEDLQSSIAQAFSHWTYHVSHCKEIVVDIQGAEWSFTDPQLNSVPKEYGRADRGQRGMQEFLASHKCGNACRLLGLPHV